MITNIEQFAEYIPTAAGSEWATLEPFVNEAKDQLKINLLGKDLFDKIVTLAVDAEARVICARLLCLQAYKNAIPFCDVIQTQNGFAVVSNANLAPASKERVERLIEWCVQQIDINTDMLLNTVIMTSALLTEWKKFRGFKELTACFFATGTDYGVYCKVENMKRKSFLEKMPMLLMYQENVLAPVISKVYLDQLIEELRNRTFTTGSDRVINYCKLILGALVNADQLQADKLLNAVSTMLEKGKATYTTYAGSDEYKLKIAPKYENKSDHPTFFFGL